MNVLLSQIGPTWLITWFTPLWILGVGALVALVILLFIWLGLFSVARRTAMDALEMLGEGALMPIFVTTLLFAIFGVVGAVFVPDPVEMLASVPRFLATGEQNITQTIEVSDTDGTFWDINLGYPVIGKELYRIRIKSDQPIYIGPQTDNQTTDFMLPIREGTEYEWIRAKDAISPLGEEPVSVLSIANIGSTAADVSVNIETKPVYPETRTIIVTAICIVGVFVLYFLQQRLFPKMSAIALATCKSEMVQPFYLILIGFGAFALFVYLFIPYNTFGEDIKMLKDSGFSTIMILGIIQAVWAASKSVSDEIEGKTALTVLSKPVGRRSFVLGKFIGIVWSVAVIFVLLGIFFLILIAYKPIYDARESSQLAPIWQDSYQAVVLTVPGLVLAFLETVVLAAISVAISTRLPMLANFSICFAIYALGHLTPLLVQSSVGNLPPVAFMGLFISAVLPMLEAFNIQAAVAAGRAVPYSYLGAALLYCCLYSLVAMLLALFLFEDRDLA